MFVYRLCNVTILPFCLFPAVYSTPFRKNRQNTSMGEGEFKSDEDEENAARQRTFSRIHSYSGGIMFPSYRADDLTHQALHTAQALLRPLCEERISSRKLQSSE